MRVAVVIPCPADPDWSLFQNLGADIVLVDDSGGRLSPPTGLATAVIPSVEALGHRSAASRNAGHLWAYREGYDATIALDYDCRPREGWLDAHRWALAQQRHGAMQARWVNPLAPLGLYSRGFPYEHRDGRWHKPDKADGKVGLNMGLWDNVLDLNAIDRLAMGLPIGAKLWDWVANPAVIGSIPVCGMNTAFKTELTPAYFFLPDVDIEGWPLSRHDDIWGGYILKKLMDKRGDHLTFGAPVVEHTRLSNQESAIVREHWMHLLARGFFALVDEAATLTSAGSYTEMYATFAGVFRSLVDRSPEPVHYRRVYATLGAAMHRWAEEFR